jgi:hypoxanthine phosphoribosyltransferase
VFGFGLDLDEYYRNLPFIGVVDLAKYIPPA